MLHQHDSGNKSIIADTISIITICPVVNHVTLFVNNRLPSRPLSQMPTSVSIYAKLSFSPLTSQLLLESVIHLCCNSIFYNGRITFIHFLPHTCGLRRVHTKQTGLFHMCAGLWKEIPRGKGERFKITKRIEKAERSSLRQSQTE